MENAFAIWCPFEAHVFLRCFERWFHSIGVREDEHLVVVSESQKEADYSDSCWLFQLCDLSDFPGSLRMPTRISTVQPRYMAVSVFNFQLLTSRVSLLLRSR